MSVCVIYYNPCNKMNKEGTTVLWKDILLCNLYQLLKIKYNIILISCLVGHIVFTLNFHQDWNIYSQIS